MYIYAVKNVIPSELAMTTSFLPSSSLCVLLRKVSIVWCKTEYNNKVDGFGRSGRGKVKHKKCFRERMLYSNDVGQCEY